MKASMKFRDNQQSPLVRMKFPISASGINLTSGIVLGDAQDLSVHIGTPAEASCPSMKLSYHPNDPSNGHFCLVMKIGMGPWGPPSMASLSVSARLRFSKVSSSGPFFSVHVKPRLGDFGLRKTAKLSSSGDLMGNFKGMVEEDQRKGAESGHLGMDHNGDKSLNELRVKAKDGNSNVYMNTFDSHWNNAINVHSNGYVSSFGEHRDKSIDAHVTRHNNLNPFSEYRSKDMDLNSHRPFDDKIAHAITPLKLDKNSLFTPLPLRSKHQNGFTAGENCWANDYIKRDHFDHGNRSDRMPGFESYSDHHASEIESPRSSSVEESSILHERGIEMACDNNNNNNTVGSVPVPLQFGSHESMKGWALHAYSMIPLGKQASLSFRWGVKINSNAFEGWNSNLSNVKIPHISLQKITISSRRCSNTELSKSGALQILGNDEEMYELSPVAALCGLMKKQVHMLYTENQVLKKAMKEMRAQFEQEIIGKPRSLRGSAINSPMDERIDGNIIGAKVGKRTTMQHLHDDNRDVSTASDWLSNEKDAPKKLSIFRWIGKRKSK